jgi:hypothetical protein
VLEGAEQLVKVVPTIKLKIRFSETSQVSEAGHHPGDVADVL